MKTISVLLAVILTLASFVASVSQSHKGKKVSSLKDESINKAEDINTANEFRPGTVFAVDTFNNLVHFDVTSPGRIDALVPIQNLQPGENILGIDFRPATGSLYGLGSTSQLYVINLVTGFASPVGGPFSPALSGTAFGFDFNPTVDRIRVVSDVGQNLQLNPDTGAVAAVDTPTSQPNIVGSAYTNNFAGTTTTTLYGIDSNTDQLVIQNPPNDGVVTPVGSLGFDTNTLVGFDIQTGSNIAYASLTAPAAISSNFFTVNLTTGVVTLVGVIAVNTIRGIAVVSGPETVFAVTTSNNLLRFDSNAPGTIVSTTPILGLQPGENILGIDFRPATGELYGLGSTSRLYKIDTANGQATQVGSGTFSTPLNGTDFGFDFNPTVDRVRVVSDAEQSMAINPDIAAVTVNANLNPPGNVVAAAYTNNFPGATSTTLYDIDSNSDLLFTQIPATGALSVIGPLHVNTTGLTGFDIARNGLAFASLTAPAASSTNLYTVNLSTGGATLISGIGGGEVIRDIAIRLTAEVVYGVTSQAGPTFNLISFNASTPNIIISTVPITGLQAGESILGIDFRPSTGGLYALGSTSRLYTINLSTGVATAVGPAFTPALDGTSFGFDFNPSVDRIRVVSNNEQNLRLNPNTGIVSGSDTNLNPPGNIVAAAYANNVTGSTFTPLYDIDSSSDQLFRQNPPNDGTLTPVGVGLGVDIGPTVGFDIAPASGIPYVSAYTGGPSPGLYILNAAGALTLVGTINTTDTLVGIAVRVSGTPTAGVDTVGLFIPSTSTWFLRNSNSAGPADTTFVFGSGGALASIKGDWDGDGDDTAGLYQPSTGAFFLRNTNASGPADIVFTYGPGGSNTIAISGDWDGDGRDSIGIYHGGTGVFFLKNTNSAGAADFTFTFGVGGGIPIAGDWNGDGVDTIGIYIPQTGTFFLRNSNSNGPADITPFTFGAPADIPYPLAGDWNGDGIDTIGIFQVNTAAWFLSNGFTGVADAAFGYGTLGQPQNPLAGDWDGL